MRHRKGFNRVRNVMREGDMLILSSIECLGSKPEHQKAPLVSFERDGITVNVTTYWSMAALQKLGTKGGLMYQTHHRE